MRVVVLSPGRWGEYRGNMHNLAIALVELGHDVLYVDPPVSPLSVLRQPGRARDLFGRSDHRSPEGVHVWAPRVLPGQNSPPGQRANARLLARGIQRRLPGPDLALALSLEARGVLRHLSARRAYVCIDSFEDFPGADRTEIRRREDELLGTVEVVIACSRPLSEQLATRHERVVFVPHGCHPAFLAPGEAAGPPDLRDRPRPLVGYVGSLNFRIDEELLVAARRAAGGGTLVIVGGSWASAGPLPSPAVQAMRRAPNVVFTGHRDAGQLPPYLWALDVGLVPYRDTPFNRKSYPIKVPQYLAAGVPVVSTPNGATDDLAAHVAIATSAEEFESAVRAALADGGPEARASRRAVAAGRPWTVVAEEILDAVSRQCP